MKTHNYYVTMTDKFMSGWGRAHNMINKLVIICETYEQAHRHSAQCKKTTRDETGQPSALLPFLRVAHSHKLEKLQRDGRMLDKNLTMHPFSSPSPVIVAWNREKQVRQLVTLSCVLLAMLSILAAVIAHQINN